MSSMVMMSDALPVLQQTIAATANMSGVAFPPQAKSTNADQPAFEDVEEDEEEYSPDILTLPRVNRAEVLAVLDSVAVDWQSPRSTSVCRRCGAGLGVPSSCQQGGVHCRRCGGLFCRRCGPRRLSLPGHAPIDGQTAVPVCAACHRYYQPLNGGGQYHRRRSKQYEFFEEAPGDEEMTDAGEETEADLASFGSTPSE